MGHPVCGQALVLTLPQEPCRFLHLWEILKACVLVDRLQAACPCGSTGAIVLLGWGMALPLPQPLPQPPSELSQV